MSASASIRTRSLVSMPHAAICWCNKINAIVSEHVVMFQCRTRQFAGAMSKYVGFAALAVSFQCRTRQFAGAISSGAHKLNLDGWFQCRTRQFAGAIISAKRLCDDRWCFNAARGNLLVQWIKECAWLKDFMFQCRTRQFAGAITLKSSLI